MREVTAVLGVYPQTAALHSGDASSPRLRLKLVDLATSPEAIPAMLREQAYDLCEMPIVTFLQAWFANIPLCLMPVTVVARFQQEAAIYNGAYGEVCPEALAGRRVGVRSWTRTTGVWLRGILAQDYGMDVDSIDWVTSQVSHIAPLRDPSRRTPDGKTIRSMLLDGEIDVAIGESLNDARVRPLFADPARAAQRWFKQYGLVPINHVVVVRESLLREDPRLVEEVYELLWQSRQLAIRPRSAVGFTPFGIEAHRPALDMIIGFAAEQRITPRRVEVNALFDDALRRPAPAQSCP